MFADLSVVVPMHATARHLPELLRRLEASVPGAEVVLVDDACPQHSADFADTLATRSLSVTVVRLSVNVGQHAAVHQGLAHVSGTLVAVMDADLQDTPEALPQLLAALDDHAALDVVCAARTGDYASAGRRRTARCYRWTARLLSRGRIPRGAGMFLVARRPAIEAVRRLDDPFAPLVPSLAAAGQVMHAVPVRRDARDDGSSGHRGTDRLRIALRGLAVLTPLRPVLASRHRADLTRRRLQVAVTVPHHPGAPHG